MIHARLHPHALRDGDQLIIRIFGLRDVIPGPAAVQITRTDTIETDWVASVGSEVQPDGTLNATWSSVRIGREAALHVTAVEVAGTTHMVNATDVSIVNATRLIATSTDSKARLAELQKHQDGRYAVGLGDPSIKSVLEHRVVCAVERLLVTRQLRLPGATVLPINERPQGEDQRLMVGHVVSGLGWPTRIDEKWWAEQIARSRPWTAIAFPQIWAPDLAGAAQLAWRVRDDLLAILGLNRDARGRPVATLIEQRQPDDSIKHRIYIEDASYGGNLVGGFISGEDQGQLLTQHAAVQSDHLLRLCLDLYGEALADPSHDARYFRLWSILETLSGARLAAGQPVIRLDGTPWPGPHRTTDTSAARVYQLVADIFRSGSMDETSFVAPASDLYEAVRCWYARRNATGHYGRFDPADARQQAQSWYTRAQITLSSATSSAAWLVGLERTVALVLNRELMTVGAGAIR